MPHADPSRPVSTWGIDTDAHVWDRAGRRGAGSEPGVCMRKMSAAAAVACRDGDEFMGILRETVVAPHNMHIRANEQQVTLVEREQLGNIKYSKWRTPCLERSLQCGNVVLRTQTQQRVAGRGN